MPIYRDSEFTPWELEVLLDAVMHKKELRGWALIMLACSEECFCREAEAETTENRCGPGRTPGHAAEQGEQISG